jgi:hypothetical protein
MLRKCLIGVLGLMGSVIVLAQPGPPAGHPGKGRAGPGGRELPLLNMLEQHLKILPDRLSMDKDQREKYTAVAEKHRVEVERLLKALQDERDTFRKELDGILTPAQREQLQEMRGRMEGPREGVVSSERPALRPRLVEKALTTVDLPQEKKDTVAQIAQETREKIKALGRERWGEGKDILHGMIEQIRSALTPDEFNRLNDAIHKLTEQQTPREHRKGPPQDPPCETRPSGPDRPLGAAPHVPEWLW